MLYKHSISKSDNKDKSMVNKKLSNTVGYFLPGPYCDGDKEKSAEITQQLQRDFEDVFNRTGCFDGIFSLQLKPDSKPYQVPPRPGISASKTFQGRVKEATKTRYHSISWCWWDGGMVQQLCASSQNKWKSKIMPRPSMIQSSANKTSTQGTYT